MKKMFLVIFGGPKLFVVLKSKNQEEHSFQSELLLKQLISRGSPEVTFCSWTKFQRAYGRSTFSKEVREKILYYRRLMPNLGRPTWDCRIWILGMWTVPYPVLILAPTSKINIRLAANITFDILFNIGLFLQIPPTIYKIPYISPHSYPRIGGPILSFRHASLFTGL